jgi:hypothetical protein
MKAIICDIDGTVLNVNERIAATLREIGVEPGRDGARVADSLRGKQRSRFFDLFLSEKYTHLDTPIPQVIASIEKLQVETALPLVFLSGRPSSMKRSTRKGLEETGLTYESMLLKPRGQQMRPTAGFKVQAIRDSGYEPAHVFDDDPEILAAIAAAYPHASYYLVTGDYTTPWPD